MALSRRDLLRGAAAGALLVPAGVAFTACADDSPAAPSSSGLARNRPTLTHGVASGDVRPDGALIWTRADQPATMIIETASTESFTNARTFTGPALTPATDGTGRFRLTGLEPGQVVHYRVTAEGDDGARSAPLLGTFTTAPAGETDIHFVWSGDVVGQGWGINPDIGGLPGFQAVADRAPQFFLHSGDAIYADNPVAATATQNDGTPYTSITAPAKAKVAQTLDDYRGNYAYNLTDAAYRAFAASVPQIIQWDDHEVLNNWFPGENLQGQDRTGGYTVNDVNTLAGFAAQAWAEWQPIDEREAVDGKVYRKVSYGPLLDIFVLDMRTYKDPNPNAWDTNADPGGILGEKQTQWLIDGLQKSAATWKIVANDLPLGIVVPDANTDPKNGPKSMEAVSQGDNGAPLGREQAFSRILTAVRDVKNIVFLTADVHYTAAISYDPNRAAYQEFSPFWEFVSGPLHAGSFPESPVDGTFGARYEFVHAPKEPNTSPAQGFQHFGEVKISKDSKVLTVNLCDITGKTLYSKELRPA